MIAPVSMRNKSLFLHLGPGMNAEPEKLAFSKANPHITFWNQPLINSALTAFDVLTKEAKKQIEILSHDSHKVNLIGHCFGASVAVECLRTHADYIEECQLIAPTFCMNEFLVSLLKALGQRTDTSEELKEKISSFLTAPYTPELFWEGYKLIMQDANFSRCYWYSSEKQKIYQTFAQNLSFDEMTFKNVVDDFLGLNLHKKLPAFSGKVSFVIGNQDSILKDSATLNLAKSHYKNSSTSLVENSSHYPHFETTVPFI